MDAFEIIKDVHLFARKLMFKIIYDEDFKHPPRNFSAEDVWKNKINEIKALNDLVQLWEDGNPFDDPLEEVPSSSLSLITTERLFPPPNLYKPKSKTFSR